MRLTQLLADVSAGDEGAAARLLSAVYDELRRIARRRMAHEPAGHTLQTTALVHEAYLRLFGPGEPPQYTGRAHFFAAAAEAMRRILIERARRQRRLRHGGGYARVELADEAATPSPAIDLLALDEALQRLEQHDRCKADIVKLRYFAGLTIEQTADAIGASPATVKDEWNFARAWLRRELCR